jgi:hypothetical protein
VQPPNRAPSSKKLQIMYLPFLKSTVKNMEVSHGFNARQCRSCS